MTKRIDACTAKLLATHEPPLASRVEWYREDGSHVVMEVKGKVIHTTLNGKRMPKTVASSHKQALLAVAHLSLKEVIR